MECLQVLPIVHGKIWNGNFCGQKHSLESWECLIRNCRSFMVLMRIDKSQPNADRSQHVRNLTKYLDITCRLVIFCATYEVVGTAIEYTEAVTKTSLNCYRHVMSISVSL
jgi:hypothetical protein